MMNRSDGFLEYNLMTGYQPKSSGRGVLFIVYAGNSMSPTLRDPELMEVMPYHGKPIRKGDVICFLSQGSDHSIVHRTITVSEKGIYTRGDHNPCMDEWVISREQVIGKVVVAWRGSKRRAILGGPLGLFLAQVLRIMNWLDRRISFWLSPIYHQASLDGRLLHLLPAHLRPRILQFRSNGQGIFFLFCGSSLIGRFVQGKWHIYRPFRLVVDPNSLMGDKACRNRFDGVN